MKTLFLVVSALQLLLVSCAATSQPAIVITLTSPENMLEEELMALYGMEIRRRYAGEESIVDDDALDAIENEVDRRSLVSDVAYREIEKGIVYLGMPVVQLLATIDGVREYSSESFAGHEMKLYKGSKSTPHSAVLRNMSRYRTPTFLVCSEKVISFSLMAATTIKKNNRTRTEFYRTNFPEGHFDEGSPAYDYWRDRNRSIPRRTDKLRSMGGRNSAIIDLSTGKSLKFSLERVLFSITKKWLDNSC